MTQETHWNEKNVSCVCDVRVWLAGFRSDIVLKNSEKNASKIHWKLLLNEIGALGK